jgi:hypothetical protein
MRYFTRKPGFFRKSASNKAITFEQDQGLSAYLAKTGMDKTAFGGAKIRHV